MGDDAPQQSLNAQSTPRTAEMRKLVTELVAAELERERERRQSRIAEILSTAGDPRFPVVPPSPRKPKRDRHGMHIVRGFGLLAAGGGWLLHSRARRVAATVAAAALVTGGTLTPGVIARAPAAQPPRPHAGARPARGRDFDVLMPVTAPALRKRRRLDQDDAFHRRLRDAPAAPHAPDPDPVASPTPTPMPTPAPTPTPTPTPTCTPLHGHHCHGGDEAVVLEALRGLTGSLYLGMPRWREPHVGGVEPGPALAGRQNRDGETGGDQGAAHMQGQAVPLLAGDAGVVARHPLGRTLGHTPAQLGNAAPE